MTGLKTQILIPFPVELTVQNSAYYYSFLYSFVLNTFVDHCTGRHGDTAENKTVSSIFMVFSSVGGGQVGTNNSYGITWSVCNCMGLSSGGTWQGCMI